MIEIDRRKENKREFLSFLYIYKELILLKRLKKKKHLKTKIKTNRIRFGITKHIKTLIGN